MLLRNINGNIEDYKFSSNYKVELEKGKVDILIYDENKAIIIENKSNNAYDMDNQLARYCKYVEDKNLKDGELSVLAVVYLPLDPSKKPNLEFDGEYKDKRYKEKIEKVLVTLPVIKEGENKKDLVHGFLEECYSNAKESENNNAKMYLKQLKNMFKFIGGDNMTQEINKDIFKKLFESTDSIEKIKNIAEFFNNRDNYLKELFCDEFIQKLKIDSSEYVRDPFGVGLRREIIENVYLVFHFYKGGLAFGFYNEKNDHKVNKKLADLLANYTENFLEFIEGTQWVGWTVKGIKLPDPCDKPIKEILEEYSKILLGNYKNIYKEAMDILN